jgi:hypothetical protein
MSHQRGSHYLKFGAEYRYHVGIGIFPNLMNLNFQPAHTASTYLSPNTAVNGDGYASFLLGIVDGSTVARGFPFQTEYVPFIGRSFMTIENHAPNHAVWDSAKSGNPVHTTKMTSTPVFDLTVPNAVIQQNRR